MSKDNDVEWMIDSTWAADASMHITLPNASNGRQGVAAEKAWLQSNFPHHQKLTQRCRRNEAGRQIDEIILRAPTGKDVSVFFDVTDWFGK